MGYDFQVAQTKASEQGMYETKARVRAEKGGTVLGLGVAH
jgi:hypothetical protein